MTEIRDLPPCRIYGILASEAAEAVLFRRGPSKEVQLIRWDTSADTFEPGQWFKGRIYERRCDLSPDGRLLVYFAASWKARLGIDGGSWTAVSRPPYLSALVRWVKGDAWSGGGLFLSNSKLGLNNGGNPHRLADSGTSAVPLDVADLNLGRGEDHPIEPVRETRDGWTVIQEMDVTAPELPSTPPPAPPSDLEEGTLPREFLEDLSAWLEENPLGRGYVTHAPRILEKPSGPRRLRREERLEGYRVRRKYSLVGSDLDLQNVDWAEWDHRGRLVFAQAGSLFAAAPGGDRPVTSLADFNPNRFTRQEAPRWALEWPGHR